jgi:hypothetical protein
VPSTRQAVEAHEWVLVRDDSSLGTDDDNPVTLSVRGDVVSGTAPCNEVAPGTLTIVDADGATTLVATSA